MCYAAVALFSVIMTLAYGYPIDTSGHRRRWSDKNVIIDDDVVSKYATEAETFTTEAETFATEAETFATKAETFVTEAEMFATEAKTFATKAETFAIRPEAITDHNIMSFDDTSEMTTIVDSADTTHGTRVQFSDIVTSKNYEAFDVEPQIDESQTPPQPHDYDCEMTTKIYDYTIATDETVTSIIDETMTATVSIPDTVTTNYYSYYNMDDYGDNNNAKINSWLDYSPLMFVALVLVVYPFLFSSCKSKKREDEMIYIQLNKCLCNDQYCNRFPRN